MNNGFEFIEELLNENYHKYSKDDITKFLLEYMAKEHDGLIQSELLMGLVTKYESMSKELERSLEEIKILSMTDPLTKIYNRLKFNQAIDNEYSRYKRYGNEFSVMMLDIDHFKRVNDQFGHDIGDQTLVHFTGIVQNQLRESDIFARWGGEEFIIMVVETTKEEALNLANRIRNNIERSDFAPVKQITVSIGVTMIIAKDSIENLVKRADEGLYIAKESGRNQVVFK